VFGIATPFYGRLGDRYGLRRMFVTGLSIFVVSSLLAGFAPAFAVLMLFRAGQALGSSAIPSLGIGMLARTVPVERRGLALGLVSAAVGLGSALGPTLGGALTQLVSWRVVFLVSSTLVLLIPLCLRELPGDAGDRRDEVDWLGGIALGTTIAAALLGIAGIQRQGATSTLVLACAAIGAGGLLLLIHRQRTTSAPFVDRALIANRRYVLLCGVGFCTMAANIGALVVLPFLFTDVYGLSSGATGLALLPSALAVAVLSRAAGRLADRVDPFRPITLGISISLATLLVMAAVAIGWPVLAFVALTAFVGIGQALMNAPMSTTLTHTVPPRIYGVGLGLYNMCFFVGGGFGAALGTALLESRAESESAILPSYSGTPEYSEFSDALLPAILVLLFALALTQVARRPAAMPDPQHPAPQ
jgi:MFS family permease